jgi:CYTH domain-containing protein
MGLNLRWSQEIEHVMGKARKCYLVTCHQRLLPVRLDSDYDKLNIKVRAEMEHVFEVKMVTGNRACNG